MQIINNDPAIRSWCNDCGKALEVVSDVPDMYEFCSCKKEKQPEIKVTCSINGIELKDLNLKKENSNE